MYSLLTGNVSERTRNKLGLDSFRRSVGSRTEPVLSSLQDLRHLLAIGANFQKGRTGWLAHGHMRPSGDSAPIVILHGVWSIQSRKGSQTVAANCNGRTSLTVVASVSKSWRWWGKGLTKPIQVIHLSAHCNVQLRFTDITMIRWTTTASGCQPKKPVLKPSCWALCILAMATIQICSIFHSCYSSTCVRN